MATPLRTVTVNKDHEPGDAEERVLDAMKHDVETYGESRMTPGLIRKRLTEIDEEESRQNVNYALGQLTAAGWVRKIADGLYEFVNDPREQ
ncbi:MAG: MarR family transcriptional regulator [Halobacteriaceae archaeon]